MGSMCTLRSLELPHVTFQSVFLPPIRGNFSSFPTAVSVTLVLREMQDDQLQQLEHKPAALTESCDVAAFVFDGSSFESFQAAHQLLLKCAELAQDSMPCVLIAAKDELVVSMVSFFQEEGQVGRGGGLRI